MDKDRAKKLETVFSQIEKQFGEGSLDEAWFRTS